jgi:hypothetical protein
MVGLPLADGGGGGSSLAEALHYIKNMLHAYPYLPGYGLKRKLFPFYASVIHSSWVGSGQKKVFTRKGVTT